VSDGSDVDFLYVIQPCGLLSDHQRAAVDAVLADGGSVVFNETHSRGARCRVKSLLIDVR
jgi:hypothetical protein